MLSEQRRQPSTKSFDTVRRIGELVRQWRTLRHLTQLELALEAGISARHLSFIESGKALPSREMVTQLAEALAIPTASAAAATRDVIGRMAFSCCPGTRPVVDAPAPK